ncbi:MAG TPA: hypothetical protein VIT88_06365 [Pyrinomonadaceae bacterium]
MKHMLFVLVILMSCTQMPAYGQLKDPSAGLSACQLPAGKAFISQGKNEGEVGTDLTLAACMVATIKRLESDVLVYSSLGDFEADGRLGVIPFEVFQTNLKEIIAELAPILSRLPESKFKSEITNALASYRDGAFWWRNIYQTRVINVSRLNLVESDRTMAGLVFKATIPYTVAIHWRQAAKYLKRAEGLLISRDPTSKSTTSSAKHFE